MEIVMMKRLFPPLCLVLLIISACSGSAPVRDFSLEELLIDPSVFPPSWQYYVVRGNPGNQKEMKAIEADSFYLDTGLSDLTGASVSVYRYQSIRSAESAFDKWERRNFNSSSIGSSTTWETPNELPYQSPIAAKQRFACHISSISGTTICQFIGQYDEFVIVFFTGFDGEHMTYDDLERILEAIDERMEFHLGNDQG